HGARRVEDLAIRQGARRHDAFEIVLDVVQKKFVFGDRDHQTCRMGDRPLHRHAGQICRKVANGDKPLDYGTSTALPTTVRSSISLKACTQSARSNVPAMVALSVSWVNQRISSFCASATRTRRRATAEASLAVGGALPPQPV